MASNISFLNDPSLQRYISAFNPEFSTTLTDLALALSTKRPPSKEVKQAKQASNHGLRQQTITSLLRTS
jgi:hypothetical protein